MAHRFPQAASLHTLPLRASSPSRTALDTPNHHAGRCLGSGRRPRSFIASDAFEPITSARGASRTTSAVRNESARAGGRTRRAALSAIRPGRWVDGFVAHVTRVFHKIGASHLAPRTSHPEATLPRSQTSMVGLLRICWHKLTVAAVVSQLTAAFVLGVACRMQGLGESTISWAVIVVAWGAVTLASLVIPTPGGLGVAEVVLVTVLGYGLPDSDQGAVVAAVLLYRLATFLLPIPIGLVTYLYWRRSKAWRHSANSRGPSAEKSSASAA